MDDSYQDRIKGHANAISSLQNSNSELIKLISNRVFDLKDQSNNLGYRVEGFNSHIDTALAS